MAIDPQVYSFSDWQMGVLTSLTTIGTAAVDPVSAVTLVDIDGPATFTPGTFMRTDIRSGTPGQIAGNADVLTCDKGVLNEVSFSCIYDTTSGAIMLPTLFGSLIGTGPAGYGHAYNWTSPDMAHDGTVGLNIGMDLTLIHPEASKSISLISGVLTTGTISGDVEEDNGQIKMSATYSTGYKPVYDQGTPTTRNVYGTTKRYITDADTTHTVAGCSNAVIKSFSLTVNNPVKYLGFQGANGDPEAAVRGLPEVEVLLDTTIKVDTNTASLHSAWATNSEVATEISDNATWGSATTFGFKGAYGRIINVTENDVGAGYYDVSQKFFAHTTDTEVDELII